MIEINYVEMSFYSFIFQLPLILTCALKVLEFADAMSFNGGCLLRSNIFLLKLHPEKMTGAGSRTLLMWRLVLKMLTVSNLFKKVIGLM